MRVAASKLLLTTRVFDVYWEKARGGGFAIERQIVRHPGSAVMLARDRRGRILLVRQFRLPARRRLWELPAGRLDPGESPLAAARRELAEETGYRARRWKRLVSFYASPGYTSERMTVYLAENLVPGSARPERDENIECRWFTLAEIDRMMDAGQIADAKSLVGLLWVGRAEGGHTRKSGRR